MSLFTLDRYSHIFLKIRALSISRLPSVIVARYVFFIEYSRSRSVGYEVHHLLLGDLRNQQVVIRVFLKRKRYFAKLSRIMSSVDIEGSGCENVI